MTTACTTDRDCKMPERCEYDSKCEEAASFRVWINVPKGRPHWHFCERHASEVDP